MIEFEEHQMSAFSNARQDGLEDRLVERVAQALPERFGDADRRDARRHVRDVLARCPAYRIDTERAIGHFAVLLGEFGDGFERTPDGAWANDVLDHPTMPGAVKIELIRQKFRARTGGRRLVPAGDAGAAP